MKIKIKFTVNFAIPWKWTCCKLALLVAFIKAHVRGWTHWNEHVWYAEDTEDDNRIIWIGTTKESSEHIPPTRAAQTYYGTFTRE